MESHEQLLHGVGLRHPCDLDLLLFFNRHRHALMTSEQLAMLLGYDLSQIAKSLDLLGERRLLLRSQNPTHSVRLYRFMIEHADRWLGDTLEVASTVEGRRHLRRLLMKNDSAPNTTSPPPDDHSHPPAKLEDRHA